MTPRERQAMAKQRKSVLRDLKFMYDEWHTGHWREDEKNLDRKALRYVRRMLTVAMRAVREVTP